jgi:hypothetical protein
MPLNTARQETYEERAAIMQYDGKMPRAKAEALAREAMRAAMPPDKMSKQYAAFREYWHTPHT